MGGIVRAVFGS